jgi:hypothetical protein
MELFLLYAIENHMLMLECRRMVSLASAFLSVFSCPSPASAFRLQGSVRYRWSQISPALPMPSYANNPQSPQSQIESQLYSLLLGPPNLRYYLPLINICVIVN